MKTIVLKHTNTCPRNVKNNEIDKVDGINALISGMQTKPQQLEIQIIYYIHYGIRYLKIY